MQWALHLCHLMILFALMFLLTVRELAGALMGLYEGCCRRGMQGSASLISGSPRRPILSNARFHYWFILSKMLVVTMLLLLTWMFTPLIMPHEAYRKLVNDFTMPLPIPKPADANGHTDMHYISFEEAVLQPFSDEHQPSLHYRRQERGHDTGDVALGLRESRTNATEQHKMM